MAADEVLREAISASGAVSSRTRNSVNRAARSGLTRSSEVRSGAHIERLPEQESAPSLEKLDGQAGLSELQAARRRPRSDAGNTDELVHLVAPGQAAGDNLAEQVKRRSARADRLRPLISIGCEVTPDDGRAYPDNGCSGLCRRSLLACLDSLAEVLLASQLLDP